MIATHQKSYGLGSLMIGSLALCLVFSGGTAMAAAIEVFPAEVNLSSQIRNAATVPATAKEPATALQFVRFILSDEGRKILEATGQPPVVPPITKGEIPRELK